MRTVKDPDFGVMQLVRRVYDSGEHGTSMLHAWEGQLGPARLVIDVDDAGDFPYVPEASRALLIRLAVDEAAIRRDIAARLIDLANDWALAGDRPEPTVDSFAAGLRLFEIRIGDDWRPTLWFEEPDTKGWIFAGQWIEAYYEANGALIHYELAG